MSEDEKVESIVEEENQPATFGDYVSYCIVTVVCVFLVTALGLMVYKGFDCWQHRKMPEGYSLMQCGGKWKYNNNWPSYSTYSLRGTAISEAWGSYRRKEKRQIDESKPWKVVE